VRRVSSLFSAAFGLLAVLGWVSACDDPPAPGGDDAATSGDASDARIDTRPAGETAPCHVDCLGTGSCAGGVATIPNRGVKPCDSSGLDCGIAAQYTCARGCAKSPPKSVTDQGAIGLLCEGGRGDGHTGAACTKDADCGSAAFYRCAPGSPRPTCSLYEDGETVCDPGSGAARCDGDKGVCVRIDERTTACLTGCAVDPSGAFALSCAASSACDLWAMGKDADGTERAFGLCGAGCHVDADCAVGVCDPAVHHCSDVECDGTKACARWGSAPRACIADASGGGRHCRIQFPKKDGDACTAPPELLGAECSCLGKGASGVCASQCTLGAGDCGAGFTCDPLFPTPTGWPAWPAGVGGRCLHDCTVDGDCLPGLVCDQTAGVPKRTCRPK